MTFNIYTELIEAILIFSLRFGIIGGLLFLAVKTKSKGIALIGIAEIVFILINIPIHVYRINIYVKHIESGAASEDLPAMSSLLTIIDNIDIMPF